MVPALAPALRAQRRRGMEEGEESRPCRRARMPGRGEDLGRGRIERHEGTGSECDDDFGPKELELTLKVRPTRARGSPVESVAGRMTLENVHDAHFLRRESKSFDRVVEDASGPAHERLPPPVLLHSGRLADEQDSRRRSAAVDDRMCPGAAEGAFLACTDLSRELDPRPGKGGRRRSSGVRERGIRSRRTSSPQPSHSAGPADGSPPP